MLTRSIDADPFGPTFEEKIFNTGKRICVAFAIAAVGVSALDMMNVRLVEAGAEFIRDSRLHYAEIPTRILTGIRQISIVPDQASVIVAILSVRRADFDGPRIHRGRPDMCARQQFGRSVREPPGADVLLPTDR